MLTMTYQACEVEELENPSSLHSHNTTVLSERRDAEAYSATELASHPTPLPGPPSPTPVETKAITESSLETHSLDEFNSQPNQLHLFIWLKFLMIYVYETQKYLLVPKSMSFLVHVFSFTSPFHWIASLLVCSLFCFV